MDKTKEKEVVVSNQFNQDVVAVFEFGEKIFGFNMAEHLVEEIFGKISDLNRAYLQYPECRHLKTKTKRYRNIILGSYLIIYSIEDELIKVLRLLHSHSSISKIKRARKSK